MNFESISESDPNLSKDSSKMDETEMQLIAESRGAHLEDINDRLQKENSKLRAQFDEAIRSSSQIVELHQKIQKLSSDINQLKSQNEELKNHLSLAIQANDDLTNKYEEEKESIQEQRNNEFSNFQSEIDKANQKLKEAIEKHEKIVSKFENDKEKINVELKTSQNLISRLLTAAEHFFESHFKSPDDLVTFLNKPPLKVQETQDKFDVSNSITVKNQQISILEKKRRKLLTKLEDQKKENECLKNEILTNQKEHFSQIQELLDKIEDLKNQLHVKEEDYSMIDSGYKHKIELLNAEILSLKNSSQNHIRANPTTTTAITTTSTTPTAKSTSIITDITSSENHTTKIINLEGNLEDMTNQNTELTQKLSQSKDQISILTSKLNDTEKEKDSIKSSFDKIQNDYNALNLLHQNTLTELQTLRIALRTHEDPQKIASKKAKIKKLKEHIEKLEKDLQSKLKSSDEEFQKCDEKLQASEKTNHLLRSENERLKIEITSLEDQMQQLNDNMGRRMIEQQMTPPAPQNGGTVFIPCPKKLGKICKEKDESSSGGDDCQYKKQLKKLLKLNDQMQKEKEAFIVSISSLFSSSRRDDFDEIIDSISIMKKENEALKSIVNHFTDVFSIPHQYNQQSQLRVTPAYPVIDAHSIIQQINDLHARFMKKNESFQKKKAQNNHLQKSLSLLQEKVDELECQIQTKLSENRQLSSTVSSLESKVAKMKRKINGQKLQIANFDRIKEENDAAGAVQVDKLVCERRKIENSLRDQLCDMSNMLNEQQRQFQALTEENNGLKKTVRCQKATIVELKLKIENLEKDLCEKEENVKYSVTSQNSNLNKTIAELQSQLQSSRCDLEKLTKQLACAHKKLIQMRTFCEESKIEKEKLSKEILTLKEQIDREKQIAEANSKTQILKAQSEFTQQLDEQKGLFEKEKRKYFTFAADQFRQFFNPQETIDEKSFKEVILRVKDELAKVNNATEC